MHHGILSNADPDALALAIGVRLRHARLSCGWTLDHLAAVAGVSRRMIVNVEQGASNPSIGTLLKISDALGIGLPALVSLPPFRAATVTRHGDGALLWQGDSGGRGVLVAGTAPPDVVELWDWTLGPGDQHTSEAHAPGTRELLHVLQGTVTIVTNGDAVGLNAGDAISFHGDMDHIYTNPGTVEARFSLAVFEPGVGLEDSDD